MEYTFSLASVGGGVAVFDVGRSEPGTAETPVMWVTVDCFDDAGELIPEGSRQDDSPLIWGTAASLDGTAELPEIGASATAWLTATPWHPRHRDLSVTFAVA